MGNTYKSKYADLWENAKKEKEEREKKPQSDSGYTSKYADIWESVEKNNFLTSLNDRLNTFTSKENEGKWWDKNRIKEADSIIQGLDKYGKDIDQKSVAEIKNYLTNNKKYYSQWATEDDYNFSVNNNNNILKYSQMSTDDLKKEKEKYDEVMAKAKLLKTTNIASSPEEAFSHFIAGEVLKLMDKANPSEIQEKEIEAIEKSGILYYDSKGEPVTYESLVRDREHEQIFEEINSDVTKQSAYANALAASKELDSLNEKLRDISVAKTMSNAQLPTRISAEEQSIVDAVQQQKAVIEDFNSLGYDIDELRYYNQMKEDREADVKKAEEAQKYAEEHEIKATFKSMLSTPMMIGEYAKNLVDTAKYGYANVYDDKYTNQSQVYQSTVANIIDDTVTNGTNSEFVGWLASTAYSGVTSATQSAMIGAVGTILSGGNVAVGTGAAMAIMGTQAAASSYNTSVRNGSTSGEAVSLSLASGIGEALFEKLPLDNLFKLAKGAGKTATKEGIATLLKGLVKQSAIEGLEEGGTELWNTMADAIINGDHSAYNIAVDKYMKQGYSESDAKKMASTDWVKELITSMVGGFIGGGVSGGAVGVPSFAINQGIQNAQYDTLGKSTIQNQNVPDLVADAQSLITEGEKSALTKLANQVAGVENVDNLSKRQSKKYTRNVGKLVDEVANTKINSIKSAQSEAIMHELESNGVENVAEATDVVIKKMSGQTLTEAETEVFESVDGNTIINSVKNREVKSAVDKDNLKRTEESLKKTGEMVFAPNKSVQHQQMVEESGYTTTEGKTTVDATGVEVDSMIIDSLDGDDVSLKVNMGEDSEIVLAGELTLNDNYAVMIEGLKRIGKKFNLNTSSANKLLALYEAYNGDAFTFYKAMEAGISYGHYNIREYFDNNKFVADLPEAIKEKLYEIGRENAQKTVDDKQASVELEGKAKAESNVTFAEGVQYHKLNKSQKAQVDFAQTIANTFGFDLEVFRSPKDASGRSLGENGSYSASRNLMRLDIDAGTLDGKSLILFTQSHELTHYIQKWSPAKYKVFADFLMEHYAKSDVPVQKLIEQKIEESKLSAANDKTGKHHVLTESEAFDEIVANAAEDFLADQNIQQTILMIAEIDQSIAQKIKNFIKNLVARLEKALSGLKGQSLEAQFVRELDLDAIQELKDLWTEALLDARENVLEARKNTPSKEKNTTDEGDVQMQLRGLNDEGIEVYETSENLKSLSLKKRKELLIDAIRNEYVGRTAKFNKNGTVYYATLDTVSARKSLYGDKKSDKKGYKAKINIGADGNYFELVENALYDSSKDEVGKTTNTDIHDNVAQWDYYIKTIISDGRYFKVLINVADKGNNQYVYDVSLKEIKKGETSSSSNATFNQEVTPDNSISNLTENVNTNDEKFQDRDVNTTINESMTMEQAKLMIQKAFVLGNIYDWYDGEYKNGDDWIRNEGASEVALYIEGEYSLMDKYFNDNQAYIDGDIYVEDVLEAYLAGTLVGKQAEKVTRLDVSKGYNVADNRFYAPKKYSDIKTLWETANAKVTKSNKAQVSEARKSFLFAAHNSDVAAELGISASEVNKKLRSWSNYSTKAKDISTRLNKGVAESNQWSGIQNCSILSQMSVTDEDISSMVKEIKGTSSEYQRNYIAKTMLALNTHIDWSELIFDFKRGSVDENRRSVRGLYENSKRTITIGGSSYQNTVAHEMGHALDYKWQRDLFGERAYNSALTNNSTRLDLIEGGEEAQQFYKNFRNFIKSLTDVNVNYSAYTMDAGETFARFVAKFVEWVNVTANSNTFRETDFYGDKFTASQYIEFVKLLQEKSKLDAKRMSEDVQYQDRNYAPTFYSQMGKVIESVKQDKLGASSVVPMLKGKGIKNEEIKWSGIETFLEGKKSVTKQELLGFVAGSMLQIEETELHIGETKWHDGYLKLPNGENYREFVFKIPNSTYTNYAMRGHWGDNAEGIIAHARVQDFIVNGNKMLFVEEIQSDWHNDGYKNGYESDITTDERVKFNKQKKVIDTLIKQLEAINKEKNMLDIDYFRNEKMSFKEYADKANILIENREKIERSIKRKEKNISKIENAIPDAPFRNTYHEYVLKRLLRMAAEEDYDSIGWTPADVQSKRWSDEYAEGYRIEYDQDIPKFLNKYGKKWGAKVGTSHVSYGTEVWSMDITDSMKDSVLYEGQALYQDRTYQPSLDDLGLRKENENLKADVENLKEMLKLQSTVTHGKVLAKAKYKDIAKKLLHDFGIKQVKDQDLLNGFVKRLDEYFSSIINSDELTWEFVMEGAYKVAKWVDYEMPTETKPKYEYAEEVLKDIRGKGVVLDDLQKAEVAYYYGSYNAFRKSLFGTINLVNKGISLDSQWQEWSSNYPHIFNANISTNDMPVELANIIKNMKETESVLNEEEQMQRVDWMAEQIYDAYWLMPTVKTLADKHQLEVNLLKGKHREQMSALREKQKAREIKTKEHYQEVLQKVKEHKDAQLDAYKEQVKEQKINERDRKSRTVMKNRIKGVVKELNSILSKGTKERNVKIPIQPAVAKALELAEYLFDDEFSNNFILTQANIEPRVEEMEDINEYRKLSKEKEKYMETMLSIIEKEGTESQVAELKDNIGKIERKMGYLEKKLASLITNEKKKLQEGGIGEAVKALADAYSQLQESEEEYVKGAYNEGVYNYIKDLANKLSGAKVREMSADQMNDVYTAFKAVLATVRDANKLFINGRREDVQQMSSSIMMQISANKKTKTVPYEKLDALKSKMLQYSWNELKPYYAFQRIGSSTLMKLYEAARQGEDVLGRDYREAIEFAEKIKKKYGYDSWDMNKRYDIRLEDGREFTVTLQEIMSIYAYSKRPQAYDHMMFGGFVFNDKKFFKSNEGAVKGLVKPKTYRRTDAEAYKLSMEDLAKIGEVLNKVKGVKGFVDEMQGYLSTDMAAKGNEISRVLYGVDWFNEKNYFPIKSSRDFLAIVNNPSENYSLRNSGMTKSTVPHAQNPLVLEDFMKVWSEHVGKMSTYHSLVIPIDNLNKVLGYKEASISMKTVIDSVFGKSAKEYLDNFLKDLNGGVSSQGAKSPIANMFGKFKKTAVAASSSVVVQQPTAILRAMAEIDARYFVGASDKLKHKEKWELIKKYAPIAVIKELGGFDIGSGRKLETLLTLPSYEGKDKVKGFFTDSKYRSESADNAFMWGATKADEIGWNIIWSAVEREIKNTTSLKVGTEEFYQKVGERFTEVVHKTQVYDSTFTRSGYQRAKSDLIQMSMAFMGEPTTTFNMLYDAVLQSSRNKISKGKKYRIIGATVSSIIFAAIMKSFIYALRDDDEDESYLEKYLESTTESLVSDLFIPNMLPFVKDVTSILSGWSVERTDFAIFTDLYESFKQLSSDNVSDYRKVEDLIGSIASLFGIPAKNLLRTGREMYNVAKNIFDKNVPYAQGAADAIYRGLPFTEEKSKTDKLYRATVNGQQQVLDKYEGENIDNSLKKGLRDNDKRILQGVDAILDSDYTKYGSIVDQIVAEGKFTKEVVSDAIQSETNYFGGKIEEGAEALRDSNDKAYKDVVKELRDRYRGIYTQDEIIKMIKNYEFETEEESDEEESIYKMKYVEDALQKGDTYAAIEMIEDIVSTKVANGKTEEEARKSVRGSLTSYWKPLYQQAFADGNSYEQSDIRASLYEMGVYGSYEEIDETLHSWNQNYVLENYKPQYIQAYQNGDTAEMRRIENEIDSLGVYKNAYKTVRAWVE